MHRSTAATERKAWTARRADIRNERKKRGGGCEERAAQARNRDRDRATELRHRADAQSRGAATSVEGHGCADAVVATHEGQGAGHERGGRGPLFCSVLLSNRVRRYKGNQSGGRGQWPSTAEQPGKRRKKRGLRQRLGDGPARAAQGSAQGDRAGRAEAEVTRHQTSPRAREACSKVTKAVATGKSCRHGKRWEGRSRGEAAPGAIGTRKKEDHKERRKRHFVDKAATRTNPRVGGVALFFCGDADNKRRCGTWGRECRMCLKAAEREPQTPQFWQGDEDEVQVLAHGRGRES
ncbi:hypothetical protein, conserved in T. vivax [Trypanosoma vivax Y486]|uniref:Uncharacterized protein n=1 Tax=Trypanosoma vivax (strain Y486) TaxID=1055687 RepID=F9WTE3_TRYVY|nr:hypothetical protein, conserved in T. vivax [Trypanosoma vivax Y486]|eukprot:CCD20836.1 hypothetical protein, conserved in T. vivax [Trypanosoma vivax Y486]